MDKMSRNELLALAKSVGLSDYHSMKKTDLINLLQTIPEQRLTMWCKSLTELREMAEIRGFLRYSSLNKRALITLLEKGYHKVVPPYKLDRCLIQSSKGLVPSEFILPPSDCKLIGYTIGTKSYDRSSRIIRGIDLTGRFNAIFIPDRTVRFGNDVCIVKAGGWVVSDHEYPNFCDFYESLLNSPAQPKSLFEIAAWVVNSRKQSRYIPERIRIQLKQFEPD
jgi:hypothetical protein